MATSATKDIFDKGIQFIRQYKDAGINWTIDDLATDIVAMLPLSFTFIPSDVIGASIMISTNYPEIKNADLIDALIIKLNARSHLKTRTISASFILGGLFLGWVLLKKR